MVGMQETATNFKTRIQHQKAILYRYLLPSTNVHVGKVRYIS